MRSDETIFGIYAIVDSTVTPDTDLSVLAEDYLAGGASVVQLRDKRRRESPERERIFRETARRIQALKAHHHFLWIVNDDLEVAREIGADGVHVGKDDPSIEECREFLGPGKIIGYSSHSLEEAVDAEKRGADYVAFGAIFPTATKGPGHPVQGLDRLREVVRSIRIPVVAIGGIGSSNIDPVIATGVASVAMISALAKKDSSARRSEVSYFRNRFATR